MWSTTPGVSAGSMWVNERSRSYTMQFQGWPKLSLSRFDRNPNGPLPGTWRRSSVIPSGA